MSFFRKVDVVVHAPNAFSGGIAEGALVRTPDGPRQIELIRPGDRVATRDGGLQKVLAIWCREITPEQMQADTALAPIHIDAAAFGLALPLEWLCIAPDHKVLVPSYLLEGEQDCANCLVEIGSLAASGAPVRAEVSNRPVRYYTIVFQSHQVFCANGLAVESFHGSPCALQSLEPALGKELVRLCPEILSAPASCSRVGYKLVRKARLSGGGRA